MPFTASFSVEQQKGGAVIITDTSNYTEQAKSAFISREIFFYKSDGTVTAVPFSFAAYPLDNIEIHFERDYCLKVLLKLVTNFPQTANRYSAYILKSFTQRSIDFILNISQSASLSSKFNVGGNFYNSMCEIITNTDGAIYAANAVRQTQAQYCLNRNYFIMDQQIVL